MGNTRRPSALQVDAKREASHADDDDDDADDGEKGDDEGDDDADDDADEGDESYADDDDDVDPHRFLLEEDSQAPNLVPEENPSNVLGGRIEIFDKIGEGGMGAVWRGLHLKLERRVAVKVLDETLQLRADSRERFIREAQALALLDHPGVVRVYDCDQVEGSKLFLCMELIEGETLREVVKRGRLDALEVIDIGVRVSDAVEAAHEQGILHRDLSPSNIMRLRDGKTVKVIDWGLCKYLDLFYIRSPRKYPAPPGARMVTPLGARFGTPEYMAPEMILRENPGPPSFRTDVYALGVVLYELLTGRHPFAPGDRREPRPTQEALPGFEHVELEAALREALRFNPEERTQTMAAFRGALEQAREHVTARRAGGALPPAADAAAAESGRPIESSPAFAVAADSDSATCIAESGAQAAVLPIPTVEARPRPRRSSVALALVVGVGIGTLGTIAAHRLGAEADPAGALTAQIEQETERARAAELRAERCEVSLEAAESKSPAIDRASSVGELVPSAPSPAPKSRTEILASRMGADASERPRRARAPRAAQVETFAEVMSRLEPKIRACAREAGIPEAPITVQVWHKGAALDLVRVLRLSKEHPFSTCVEPFVRKAKPPPGESPIEDFTYFKK